MLISICRTMNTRSMKQYIVSIFHRVLSPYLRIEKKTVDNNHHQIRFPPYYFRLYLSPSDREHVRSFPPHSILQLHVRKHICARYMRVHLYRGQYNLLLSTMNHSGRRNFKIDNLYKTIVHAVANARLIYQLKRTVIRFASEGRTLSAFQ